MTTTPETETAEPSAERITLNTLRQWAERTLATSVAGEGYTTSTACTSRGYEHAAVDVLAILDATGAPPDQPVVFRSPDDPLYGTKPDGRSYPGNFRRPRT